jgi:DNA replication protein DnaC
MNTQSGEQHNRPFSLASLPPGTCRDCSAEIGRGQICDECNTKRIVREHDRDILRALENSIPRRFRWASFDAPELSQRVRPARAIEEARALDLDCSAVLLGETGSGKTCLGASHLRRIARAGRYGAAASDVHRAECSRFLASIELMGPDSDPEIRRHAALRGVLVLDDLGAELLAAPAGSPLAAMRGERTARLLLMRHNEGLPTVVTTWLDFDGMGAIYGYNLARRVYEDAVIVRLAGAPVERVAA